MHFHRNITSRKSKLFYTNFTVSVSLLISLSFSLSFSHLTPYPSSTSCIALHREVSIKPIQVFRGGGRVAGGDSKFGAKAASGRRSGARRAAWRGDWEAATRSERSQNGRSRRGRTVWLRLPVRSR